MYCLWCDTEIILEVSWVNLLYPDPLKPLCKICEKELHFLKGELCRKCGRESRDKICPDCLYWEKDGEWRDLLAFNQSVFAYNERMQEMLAKWKYRGDYVLKECFACAFKEKYKSAFPKQLRKEAWIVPVPLSEQRLHERGFNQAEALASLLEKPVHQLLSRTNGEKQSKKTRRERLGSENPFKLEQAVDRPVILIDDIYTTGVTLRHAARVLKESGCPEVYALTLARG
ncbi:ComF family protein [Sediminibacillus massiliensis]|uniref:ComF family protein n=1 Tax=Sediminibacillus massiliensis TaxID=1926277 RepID=UPI00098831D0|nr:ComF family protein [Sediminibacillus massiliensis]